MNERECRHCRWSEAQWTIADAAQSRLVCTHPKRLSEFAVKACDFYEREPGSDDDKEAAR